MTNSEIMDLLVQVVRELEESGDIVVVNPNRSFVPKKIFTVIERFVPSMLSRDELTGIVNVIGAHQLGFALDDRDFQTIIGVTKEELNVAARKLNDCHAKNT